MMSAILRRFGSGGSGYTHTALGSPTAASVPGAWDQTRVQKLAEATLKQLAEPGGAGGERRLSMHLGKQSCRPISSTRLSWGVP